MDEIGLREATEFVAFLLRIREVLASILDLGWLFCLELLKLTSAHKEGYQNKLKLGHNLSLLPSFRIGIRQSLCQWKLNAKYWIH